jgi:hypothetical protein
MNQDFHPSYIAAKPDVLSEDVILLVELYKLERRSCTVPLLFGKLVVLRKVENLSSGPDEVGFSLGFEQDEVSVACGYALCPNALFRSSFVEIQMALCCIVRMARSWLPALKTAGSLVKIQQDSTRFCVGLWYIGLDFPA